MIDSCPTPQLFLEVGNENANSFWAANLPLEEELHSAASAEQRATFVRRKYRERKHRRVLEGLQDAEQLNQVQTSGEMLWVKATTQLRGLHLFQSFGRVFVSLVSL